MVGKEITDSGQHETRVRSASVSKFRDDSAAAGAGLAALLAATTSPFEPTKNSRCGLLVSAIRRHRFITICLCNVYGLDHGRRRRIVIITVLLRFSDTRDGSTIAKTARKPASFIVQPGVGFDAK